MIPRGEKSGAMRKGRGSLAPAAMKCQADVGCGDETADPRHRCGLKRVIQERLGGSPPMPSAVGSLDESRLDVKQKSSTQTVDTLAGLSLLSLRGPPPCRRSPPRECTVPQACSGKEELSTLVSMRPLICVLLMALLLGSQFGTVLVPSEVACQEDPDCCSQESVCDVKCVACACCTGPSSITSSAVVLESVGVPPAPASGTASSAVLPLFSADILHVPKSV